MYFNDQHKSSVKMKLINYKILPRDDIKDINNELKKVGVFSLGNSKKEDEAWRVKKPELKPTTAPEEKYFMNEILKKYIFNTRKSNDGLNYKYFQNFTDLLTKKNDQKIYPKKRLELFYNRINNSKNKNISNSFSNNFLLDPYLNKKIKKNKNTIFITYIENLNKIKNRKFLKKHHKYMDNLNYINNKNENLDDFFNMYKPSKTYYNNDKSYYKNCLKNNKKYKFSDDNSFFLSQYNSDDNYKTKSIDDEIPAKEELLKTGDNTKYLEFLQNKYKFFYNPKSNYSNEKKKRIKLFKKKPNSKYLDKVKKDSFKNELFNRIKREKMNKNSTTNKTKIVNVYKPKKICISLKEINKVNFDKECNNILINIQNNLQHI